MFKAFLFAAVAASFAPVALLYAEEIPVNDPVFETPAGAPFAILPNGDGFLTIWQQSGGVFHSGIYASTLDLDGGLRRQAIAVSPTGGAARAAAGLNGTLVVWLDGASVFTAFLDRSGNVSSKRRLADIGAGIDVTIAASGRGFIVLLSWDTIDAYRFDNNGQLVAGPLSIGGVKGPMTISGDADGYLVFAEDFTERKIIVRRIESGAIQPWSVLVDDNSYHDISSYFDGSQHILFWTDRQLLHVLRVATDGSPLPSPSNTIETGGNLTRAQPAGNHSLLVLQGLSGELLMLVDLNGTLATVATTTLADATGYNVATVGTRALIESSPALSVNPRRLMGRLVDTAAGLQVGQPIELGRAATAQRSPDLAVNRNVVFAVWSEASGDFLGSRIDPRTHAHLDGTGIEIAPSAGGTVIANGDGFLVAWMDVVNGLGSVKYRRISASGELVGQPVTVSTAALGGPVRLASDGSQILLVWYENNYSVRAVRIAADGGLIDFVPLTISNPADGAQWLPDVTFDGNNYLIAWLTQKTVGRVTTRGISAVHLSRAGGIIDPTLHFATGADDGPEVTTCGSTFAVLTRSQTVQPTLQLTTITSRGVLGPTVDVATSEANAPILDFDIARDGNTCLVTWTTSARLLARHLGDSWMSDIFEPLPDAAGVAAPSLKPTPQGLALAYTRSVSDENFGGSQRAFLLFFGNGARVRALSH